jgi:hypothetical protein
MADITLTQDEADALIAMEKTRVDDKEWFFPSPGERCAIPLTSIDKRESFMLDVTRAQIRLTKATYQNRARQALILMRLDLDGPPHPNPETAPSDPKYTWLSPYAGQTMLCPHLHIYVEGYGDKWAIPAPGERYPDCGNLFATFQSFMQHCNITAPPAFQVGLF